MFPSLLSKAENDAFYAVDQFTMDEIAQETLDRLNRAMELYIARHVIRLHYVEHRDMKGGPVSITQLLSWLNDYQRGGETVRQGVVSLYFEERKTRRTALYFPEFFEYAREKLTKTSYIGSRQKREMFHTAFESAEWLKWARPVMAQKYFERLHDEGLVKTQYGAATAHAIRHIRKIEDSFAKINYRIVRKTEEETTEETEVLLENFIQEIRISLSNILSALHMPEEETVLLRKYQKKMEKLVYQGYEWTPELAVAEFSFLPQASL